MRPWLSEGGGSTSRKFPPSPICLVCSSSTRGSQPIFAALHWVLLRASLWAETGKHWQTWLNWFPTRNIGNIWNVCQFWWSGASGRAIYSPLNWTSTSRTKLCFKQQWCLLLQQCNTKKYSYFGRIPVLCMVGLKYRLFKGKVYLMSSMHGQILRTNVFDV